MAEPFVTLSSESTSESTSGSESFDNPTPLSTPPATTHDTSRASFHVRDLEQFAKDLQNAADRAFPNQGRTTTRYRDVSVLLLRWEDDEMNVDWELEDLEKVFKKYGFGTERWLIPRKNSHLKLMSKAIEVVEEHDDDGNLVIIYYAGHALINSSRQATWSCKSDVRYASLEWSAIQTLFEKANMDVLLLLDCCAAASAAPTVGSAVTETIAACGFENIAPQPGRHSFTNSLIEVLEDWIDAPPFSAAMLHNKVLSVLKHEQPERAQNGKRRKVECRRTPIHIMGTADPKLPSIELGRRVSVFSPPPANPEIEVSVTPCPTVPSRVAYELESLNKETENGFDAPRVIISLSLEHDQNLNSETCEKWLTSCPALIKHAKVEAVYKSFSVLVLLSVPVLIWDLLPEHPACSFVGFATSSNLFRTGPIKDGKATSAEATEWNIGRAGLNSCSNCRRTNSECDSEGPGHSRDKRLYLESSYGGMDEANVKRIHESANPTATKPSAGNQAWTVHVSLLLNLSQPFPFEPDTAAFRRCLSRGLQRRIRIPNSDNSSFCTAINETFSPILRGRAWEPLVAKVCNARNMKNLPMLRQLPGGLVNHGYDKNFLQQNCAVVDEHGMIDSLYIAMSVDTISWDEMKRLNPCIPGLEDSWAYDPYLDFGCGSENNVSEERPGVMLPSWSLSRPVKKRTASENPPTSSLDSSDDTQNEEFPKRSKKSGGRSEVHSY